MQVNVSEPIIVGPHSGREDYVMEELTNEDILALARAVGLTIEEPELTDVGYSLNAILEAMDAIDPPGLNAVEPMAVILPDRETRP